MKKLLFMAVVAVLASCMISCNDNDEQVHSGQNATSQLSIETEISSQTSSLRSSGPLSVFPENSTLSLFICNGSLGTSYPKGPYNNVKAEYLSGKWTMDQIVRLTNDAATVYALYPYMASLGDGINTITIDHTTQTDYMYGTNAEGQPAINSNNPSVRLRMQHTQAMLQFNISKLNYEEAGKLTKVEIGNGTGTEIYSKGRLDIVSGNITKAGTDADPVILESAEGLLMIPDIASGNEDGFIKAMLLPVNNTSANGSVQFRFTIDGTVYSYNVPANTNWKGGTKYTYNVTLNGTQLNIGDVIINDWIDGPSQPMELY